jgi:hypothetical protein
MLGLDRIFTPSLFYRPDNVTGCLRIDARKQETVNHRFDRSTRFEFRQHVALEVAAG